ncbi:MAG: hypothetical protein EBT80_09845 [Chitinophagales bacterium]|nr:hypothetical protein [Chitinophagales bacterium]
MARYRLWMGITLALGILFVGLQWNGFTALWSQQITFRGSGAGQFLYVIFGLHALHVVGGVVVLSVLLAKAFFGMDLSLAFLFADRRQLNGTNTNENETVTYGYIGNPSADQMVDRR